MRRSSTGQRGQQDQSHVLREILQAKPFQGRRLGGDEDDRFIVAFFAQPVLVAAVAPAAKVHQAHFNARKMILHHLFDLGQAVEPVHQDLVTLTVAHSLVQLRPDGQGQAGGALFHGAPRIRGAPWKRRLPGHLG
jgi:hypothetical protein